MVVRIPAGPLGSLKCDPPKGNGRRPQKKIKFLIVSLTLISFFVPSTPFGYDQVLFSQSWRPLPGSFFVWFCCGCVCFVCLLAPLFVFCVYGTARWTVYWSITSAFEAIQVQTALHDSQFIFLLRLNVCNDLAKP